MSPVAARGEIAEPEFVLQSQHNLRHPTCDLSGDECFTPQRTLMIEENSVAGKHSISLAIVYSDPVCVEFSHAIGRSRIERCRFRLWYRLHLTIEFRRRCLVNPGLLLETEDAHRFQYS